MPEQLELLPGYRDLPNFEDKELYVRIPTGEAKDISIFDEKNLPESEKERFRRYSVGDKIKANVLLFALNSFRETYFDKIKIAYPAVESMSEFIGLVNCKRLLVEGNEDHLKIPEIQLKVAKEVAKSVIPYLKTEAEKPYVTKEFYPKPVKGSFDIEISRRGSILDREVGKPQKEHDNALIRLDLSNKKWYIYDENYGTIEEKSFVRWFAEFLPLLEENGWTEIMLARNEKAVKLYSWFEENKGTGFEPDFVLLMKKDNIDYVFYIEPKGNLLINNTDEQWKEIFLLEIEKVVAEQQENYSESAKWRVLGMPFFNYEQRNMFEMEFKKKVINEA
jgi:type III restriction enzyme